jgi:uncharacterized membrane protein YciS (DUF1049 family)
MFTELIFPSLSATALFLLALHNRYAAIVSRIRSLERERIKSNGSYGDFSNMTQTLNLLLQENEYQIKKLFQRANAIRISIGCLIASMMLFSIQGIVAMVVEMQSKRNEHEISTTANYALLMSGLCFVTLASASVTFEIYMSLKTVHHEAQVVHELTHV